MATRQLRRRGVGGAVVHTVMEIMSSRLTDARRLQGLIALIDSVLHLLKNLIQGNKIILGTSVAHRRKLVGRSRLRSRGTVTAASTANSHRSRHGLILCCTVEHGKLKSLNAHEALAHSGIRAGVKLTSLQIAKEFIESIVAALLGLVRAVICIRILIQGVIHVTICRRSWLRWRGRMEIRSTGTRGVTLADNLAWGLLKVMAGVIG